MRPTITLAVEGPSDQVVMTRVLDDLGIDIAHVYGLKGKSALDRSLAGYNLAARREPWLVVRDLDKDAVCAPQLIATLLREPAKMMTFRIAVHSIESWLLADSGRLSEFLHIPITGIPLDPDTTPSPKQLMVNLARQSRAREIRLDMVPAPGVSGVQGPAYTTRIVEFATQRWRPRVAAKRSPSLARCMAKLRSWL